MVALPTVKQFHATDSLTDQSVLKMPNFKSGDLVVLKSGGPTMTVDTVNTDIFDDDKITGLLCVWFIGDIMQRVRFDYRAVRLLHAAQEHLTPTESGAGTNGVSAPAAAAATGVLHPPIPVAAKVDGKSNGKSYGKRINGRAAAAARKRPATDIVSEAVRETAVAQEAAAAAEAAAPVEALPAPPPSEPTPQQNADYTAVLESMVGAMNALMEATDPAPRPPRRTRVKPTVRVTARKASATTH